MGAILVEIGTMVTSQSWALFNAVIVTLYYVHRWSAVGSPDEVRWGGLRHLASRSQQIESVPLKTIFSIF